MSFLFYPHSVFIIIGVYFRFFCFSRRWWKCTCEFSVRPHVSCAVSFYRFWL